MRIVGVKRKTGTVVGVTPTAGHYTSEDVTVEIDGVEVGTFSQLTTYRNAANVINFVKTDISPGSHNCRIYSKSYPLKFFAITRIDVDETDGSFDNYYTRPTLASPEDGTQRIEVIASDKKFLAVNALTDTANTNASRDYSARGFLDGDRSSIRKRRYNERRSPYWAICPNEIFPDEQISRNRQSER